MKKNMLYFIEKSSIETGDFSRVYIPKDNTPYKVLNGKPFILNSKKVGVGELGYSKECAIETNFLQSCIALYFIYDEWILMVHIHTGRTNGYSDVKRVCNFVKQTNKKNKKVIYGVVEGINPYNIEDEHRKAVFNGVEDIPTFLEDYELERKQDLMSFYVIITKDQRIVIRNQINKLNEVWDIDHLPNHTILLTNNGFQKKLK